MASSGRNWLNAFAASSSSRTDWWVDRMLTRTTEDFEVKDRVALVTGASSGIGAATAELLAREGAIVAAVARRADRLEDLVKRIEAAGYRAAAFPADIARESEARKVVADVLARHGRIDILVNGAGIVRPGQRRDRRSRRVARTDRHQSARRDVSLPGSAARHASAPRWTYRHGLLHGRPLRGHPPQRLYGEQARRECVLRDVAPGSCRARHPGHDRGAGRNHHGGSREHTGSRRTAPR